MPPRPRVSQSRHDPLMLVQIYGVITPEDAAIPTEGTGRMI
jgi:hypothetical protein